IAAAAVLTCFRHLQSLQRGLGRCASPQVARRFVSELCHISPQTPGQHGYSRGHVDAYRCCVKSLIASALVGFRARKHARAESISKRAPSTTRTSLRIKSTTCERSPEIIAHASDFRVIPRITLH